jgi:hypothetical protein
LSTIAHLSTLLHVSCCSSLDLLATSIVVATEAPSHEHLALTPSHACLPACS